MSPTSPRMPLAPLTSLLVTWLALTGCAASPVAPTPSPAVTVSIGPGVEFVTSFPTQTEHSDAWPECTDTYTVVDADDGQYVVAVVSTGCGYEDNPLNGRHGWFSEPPPSAEVEAVDTPVGTAKVFTSTYTECTNDCNDYADEVAVVSTSSGVVQVMAMSSSKTPHRSRERLTEILQGIQPM